MRTLVVGFRTEYTLALGTPKVYTTLDMNYTLTDFTRLDSALSVLVITSRVGMVVKRPWVKGAVHIGAMWQDTNQTVELTVNTPELGPIKVSSDQSEPKQWNFLVVGLWAIDERVHVVAEISMGGGTQLRHLRCDSPLLGGSEVTITDVATRPSAR